MLFEVIFSTYILYLRLKRKNVKKTTRHNTMLICIILLAVDKCRYNILYFVYILEKQGSH